MGAMSRGLESGHSEFVDGEGRKWVNVLAWRRAIGGLQGLRPQIVPQRNTQQS